MGRFRIFLAVSTILLILINIYLYQRYKKLARSYNFAYPGCFWAAVFLTGFVIFISSLFLQDRIYRHAALTIPTIYASSFYLGMLMYSLLLFAAGDALLYAGSLLLPKSRATKCFSIIYAKGLLVPAAALLITLYAFYNAVDYKVTTYELSINKKSSTASLDIVMISDLHAGTSVKKKQLLEIKRMVEGLSPDLFVICGDFFDHGSSDEIMRFSAETLGSVRTKYGTCYVTGNHEYYMGDVLKVLSYFDGTDIKILRDEMVTIGDIFLAGRNDMRDPHRRPLSEILTGADRMRPLIVIDHQPNAITEAAANGVDLQLSGHTHNGQLFPFNYIVGLANHTHYGLHEEGRLKAVVSSGAGTWKYPIRTGSSSEIVHIKLTFLN